MIEQASSLALTIAHHTGNTGFAWDALVDAVTTLDAGTAIGSEYIPMERRAVAIHEAGHAVAGHVYLTGRESTRLTIKKRGVSIDADALRRQLRLSGDSELTVVLTRVAHQQVCCVVRPA